MSADAGPDSSDGATSAPATDHAKAADSQRSADSDKKDGGRAPDDSGFRDSRFPFVTGSGTYERQRPFRADVQASVTGGEGQRVHIGHTYYYAGRVAAPPPGPVRPELLETVRERYVKVSGYSDLHAAIRERRLLMLGGAPATGRSFTALQLLDKLTGGDVMRLDATTTLCSIGEDDLKLDCGYLGELAEGDPPLHVNQADRLVALLGRRNCYLIVVVTVDHMRSEAFPLYGLECPPPDANELIDQHIDTQLKPTDHENLKEKVAALAASPRLRTALGPRPTVAETVGFARLLLAHGRGEISLQQVEEECNRFVKRQVIEWFGALPRAPRYDVTERTMQLAGFQLGLSVLNEMPRSVVAQLSEDLAVQLIKAVYPQRTPGRSLFADPEVTLLDRIRAHTTGGHIYYSSGSVPVDAICFHDNRYPQAVLSYVWQQYHNVRPPLVNWLLDLARDPRSYVRECAAEAAGMLCWVDFSGAYDDLIQPAAHSEPPEDPSERDAWWIHPWFAALALDQASQDERLRTVVEGILKEWRRRGSHSERCTAAIAHGYPPIHRSVETSLEELRIIGTPQELDDRPPLDEVARREQWELIWAAGLSIARLFAAGNQRTILNHLCHWIQRREHADRHGLPQRASLRRLALQTIILMADLKLSALFERQFIGTRTDRLAFPENFEERRKWPLLLALLDDDPSLINPIAYLLRQALRSPAGEIALKKLDSWMRAGQADAACVDVLINLLPKLIENEADRARLLDLIRRRSAAWADTLRPDIAERLTATLVQIPNGKRDSDERG